MVNQVTNILFIDDDEVQNFINSRIVEHLGVPINISCVLNGVEGLEFLEKCQDEDFPEVIFVDIDMPKMNGFEFLVNYEKKYFKSCPNTKLYILSTSVSPKDKYLASTFSSVADYFEKPLTGEVVDIVMEKKTV